MAMLRLGEKLRIPAAAAVRRASGSSMLPEGASRLSQSQGAKSSGVTKCPLCGKGEQAETVNPGDGKIRINAATRRYMNRRMMLPVYGTLGGCATGLALVVALLYDPDDD